MSKRLQFISNNRSNINRINIRKVVIRKTRVIALSDISNGVLTKAADVLLPLDLQVAKIEL